MEQPKALFRVDPICLEGAPLGTFRYASRNFAEGNLPVRLLNVLREMYGRIKDPKITYRYEFLKKGERFGHGRPHCDGKEEPEEVHRLLTFGGTPTLGQGDFVLEAGTVWEYSGAYAHRALPVEKDTMRLMLRVSETQMRCRNHWSHAKYRKDNVG